MGKISMKYLFLASIILISGCKGSSKGEHTFIDKLLLAKESKRNALVNKHMADATAPIIKNNSVTFIYVGQAGEVAVAGDFNSWDPKGYNLKKIAGTDVWHLSMPFEEDARLDYKLVVDSSWILDPLNPSKISGGYGENSQLIMPEYSQQLTYDNKNADKGALIIDSLFSLQTKRTYKLDIYLPHGYDEQLTYPSVYFQDGSDYLNLADCKAVLDVLIFEKKIEPVIAVFVTPNNRDEEYVGDLQSAYSKFFAIELADHIDRNYSTIKYPDSRAVIGDSYGGNISAFISYNFPDVFGLTGWHSAAFWPKGYEMSKIVRSSDKHPVKVALVWGSYEGELAGDMQKVSKALKEAGVDLYSKEYHEGHSWGLWKATTDEILIFFFGQK